MSENINRRNFLKKSIFTTTGIAAGLSIEENILQAAMKSNTTQAASGQAVKGLQTGKSTDSGFIQNLDIFLTLTKLCDEFDEDELQFMKKDLLVKLEEQSAGILPFRCFLNGKE